MKERAAIDADLALRSLAGRSVPVRAREVVLEDGELRAVFRIAPDEWRRVLAERLFNLADEDERGRIEGTQPVEIEAVLRADVAAALSPDAVVVALRTGDASSAVTCTEAWRAANVVAETPLPDGMSGSLKTGFRTTWADGRPPAEPPAQDPVNVIARVMRVHGMVLEDLGEGLYRTQSPRWTVLVRVSGPVCAVYSVHPKLVTPDRRGLLGEWLVNENYDIAVGAFEMDGGDGEVRFRTALDVTGDRLTDALFERLLVANLAEMTARFDRIG
ncbi:MAG TPA: hypothetical protein VM261_30900 [Kofleriaceae bacterium]|nr:hypothetical protein [Kofleriaceae bacterium]